MKQIIRYQSSGNGKTALPKYPTTCKSHAEAVEEKSQGNSRQEPAQILFPSDRLRKHSENTARTTVVVDGRPPEENGERDTVHNELFEDDQNIFAGAPHIDRQPDHAQPDHPQQKYENWPALLAYE
jgi:hypothetical protein